VTLTYQALADPCLLPGRWIRNTALLDDGAGRVHGLPAQVWTGWQVTLPLVMKGP
jgi:hypothetical protein